MPHYKCDVCRSRLRVSAKSAELPGDSCPECGSGLEPVTELIQLVGYRSIPPRGGGTPVEESEPHQGMADVADDFVVRRASIVERQRVSVERWLDDSDDPDAATVVLTPPATHV
jgi:hypothetical protein